MANGVGSDALTDTHSKHKAVMSESRISIKVRIVNQIRTNHLHRADFFGKLLLTQTAIAILANLMTITFKKGKEKSTMTCHRADNTTTWMATNAFFIMHDLAHFAVEKMLGLKKGFYGLVETGMDITDFKNKQKFKPSELPAESIHSEILVNLFLTELSDGRAIGNFQGEITKAAGQLSLSDFVIDMEKIVTVRKDLVLLIEKWNNLQPQEELRLEY
jgi:hypothetical protein